jgi:hypothetical protein
MVVMHGKHIAALNTSSMQTDISSSPGRFFAANQLKLLLAQIVLNYEIERIEQRPENPWLNNTIGPPMWSTIRVRRRLNTTKITHGQQVTTKLSPTMAPPTKESRCVPNLIDTSFLQSFASSAHELASPLTLD